MSTKHRLTRCERLGLAGAALRGFVAGATHTILIWLINLSVGN
jgi:hypothetical protein